MLNYFMRMTEINPNFFYTVKWMTIIILGVQFGWLQGVGSLMNTMETWCHLIPYTARTGIIYLCFCLLFFSVEAFEDGRAEFIDEFKLHHNTWLLNLFED
ncbi:hypothetical protein Ahy_B04g073001 isoform A [Arachis hypogaea]|uniref:Uncharacterized protein n=1 Tax=Arachis hypogaea TaxID=3818 RepID=A0A444ZPH1_ARAHY|nr:hypothetical protein Ahy_B04g073001 isoform A [Arachis hypogaea]